MRSLITYWHMDLIMAIFLILICILFNSLNGFRNNKRSGFFFTGLALILLSVSSPLNFLGEHYLMAAHMINHVIILLVAAPLIVAGIPDQNGNSWMVRFSTFLLKNPWMPWAAGVCIMWFWHIPSVFNLLLRESNPVINTSGFSFSILTNLHLISLVIAGILFSWPVVGPVKSRRLLPLTAVLYLSGACIFCSLLGLMITFAPVSVYPYYAHMQDRYGFLNMIRNINGISAEVDRQIAGLIMWVPGCLIYLSASMYILFNYFRDKPVLESNNSES